jgi:hypothetical protein
VRVPVAPGPAFPPAVPFHPATLLIAWGVFALFVQQTPLAVLGAIAVIALPAAWWRAHRRCRSLLRRARWLFLSIIVLFAFATPGRPLVAGLTAEGLTLAAEHTLRLALLLATLGVVHEILGNRGLLAGLHFVLAPLAWWRNLRERIVARLMLVLDYVENGPGVRGWRAWLSDPPLGGAESLDLPLFPMGFADWATLTLLAAGVAWYVWR